MDEEIDILDSDGNPTGKTSLKSVAHKNGWCHPTVHIWLYTQDGKVVLQQRGSAKRTFPNLWDVSVAGHVGAGEDIEDAAVREVAEEVGYTLRKDQLERIGVFKEVHHHRADFTDCEFHHTYIAPLQVDFSTLIKEANEVAQLALKPYLQVVEESWGQARNWEYVPHSSAYYQAVFGALKERL